MAEQPLSISVGLTDTKTAIPLIKDGEQVVLKLGNLTQPPRTEKGDSLRFEYDLVNPAPDSDGGTINPGAMGSKVFENIQLYAKPDAKDPFWFKKRIAARIDALLGTGDQGNKKGKPERPDLSAQLVPQLIGKTLIAKMRVRTGEYTGNEIASTTYPGDIAS
jgi:hypothetical protein